MSAPERHDAASDVPRGAGNPLELAGAWLFVGVPLVWGVYQVFVRALALFTER